MSAKDKQVGGGHYKDMPIQPIDFIVKNGLPFIEGCIVKYISRWRSKGGVQDLRKVIHYAELLIEAEEEAEKAEYDLTRRQERAAVQLGHPMTGDRMTPEAVDALKRAFGPKGDPANPDRPLDAQNRAPAANSFIPPYTMAQGELLPGGLENGRRILAWRPRSHGSSGAQLYGWVEIGFMWGGRLVPHECEG